MTAAIRLRDAIALYRTAADARDGWACVGAYANLRRVVAEIGSSR